MKKFGISLGKVVLIRGTKKRGPEGVSGLMKTHGFKLRIKTTEEKGDQQINQGETTTAKSDTRKSHVSPSGG